MGFFAELKRRHVFRVAALYIIVGWLVLQVVDVLTSLMPVPDWTGRVVFVLLVAGFPVGLILAWAFDLTPDGVQRETPDASAGRGGRGFDFLLVGALIVLLGYWAWDRQWQQETAAPSSARLHALVVLPLENLMNEDRQAYFVDGMHEALITELSKIQSLRIISRTSAMKYKNAGKSVPEIGNELGVDAVIEGSVLRSGDTVRITVQLIDAHSDQHIWSSSYDRKLTDIFSLYADVTREIASQIRASLSPGEAAGLAAVQTVNPDAYETYLKGKYFCDKWSPQEMNQGIQLMREAVAQDPGFALGQAGLSICLQYAAFYHYLPPLDVLQEASDAAQRAVQLNPRLPNGHIALAGELYYLRYDAAKAEVALQQALELNPAMVRALIHYAWLLAETGRFEEALEPANHAVRLDPLSPIAHITLGQVHFLSRDYPKALKAYGQALALDNSDPATNDYLGWAYEQTGDYERALAHHRQAVELSGGAPLYVAGLGYCLALAGQTEAATARLQQLTALQETTHSQAYNLGMVHLGLEHYDQAMEYFEQAYQARNSQIVYLRHAPQFDPLRKSPRFQVLLDKLNASAEQARPPASAGDV